MYYNTYNIDVKELDENSETFCMSEDDDYTRVLNNLEIKLKPHQLTLLKHCIKYENYDIKLINFDKIKEKYSSITENDYFNTQIGIIGDKVGSGKSFVILVLMLLNKNIKSSQIETYGYNKVFLNISRQNETFNTNVIVVPHNLYFQWIKYINIIINEEHNFKCKFIKTKKHLEEFIQNAKKINEYDLILITDTHFKIITNILTLNHIKINRLIFDEIDSIKIPSNKFIDSKFLWFLTASYGNILYPNGYEYYDHRIRRYIAKATGLNNNGYIKDLLSMMTIKRYKLFTHALILKNLDNYVDNSFNIPIPNNIFIECKDPIETTLLNGIVNENIIQFLNADDTQSAIQLFDSRQKKNENNIIDIVINKYNTDIHNLEVNIDSIKNMRYYMNEEENNNEKMIRINKIKDKIKILDEKILDIKNRINNNNICNICYEDLIKNKNTLVPTLVKCCSNKFCFKCINLWLSNSNMCPLCKYSLKKEDLFLISEDVNEEENEIIDESVPNPEFDKMKNLKILIKNIFNSNDNTRLIIFSSSEYSLEKIENILNNLNINYTELKGNKYIIKKNLESFYNGANSILLVNIYNYGSGLNLECATDIIMFHKFDKLIEKQVIGRAQRFGRKNSLNIHYLLNKNELSIINK